MTTPSDDCHAIVTRRPEAMPDTIEPMQDRRPALVICPCEDAASVWDLAEDLTGQPWSPPGVRTIAVSASPPEDLVQTLVAHLVDPDVRGLLLIGLNRRSERFRVQMRAENRGFEPGAPPLMQSPSIARATAPAAGMIEALHDMKLPADASSQGEEDIASYLLYRILCALPDGMDAPSIGLLRVPETGDADTLERGIKAVAGAISRHMSPLPRARHSRQSGQDPS